MMTEVTPDQQMKLLYPHRPWENEPDNAEWFDASTGYKCRIQRQTENSGTLCGYVGVFKGHPLHGMGYNDVEWDNPTFEMVHGGLTYSKTDDNAVHWFGFDTAHGGDFCPEIARMMLKYAPESDTKSRWMQKPNGVFGNETYRTWEYVEGEVHKLVEALWKIERHAMLGGDHE